MYPMTAQTIKEALTLIFQGIERLHEAFPSRAFTIDGRLVGDIGEVIAELEYDLTLDEVSVRDHDAQMRNGRRVQIKATFKDSLTFTTCPDYYHRSPLVGRSADAVTNGLWGVVPPHTRGSLPVVLWKSGVAVLPPNRFLSQDPKGLQTRRRTARETVP